MTRDDIPDSKNLCIRCWANGSLRQYGATANMTLSIRHIVSYFSRITLEADDIAATGTPAGIGIFPNPVEEALLKNDDRIKIEIDRIGRLSNTVVAEAAHD